MITHKRRSTKITRAICNLKGPPKPKAIGLGRSLSPVPRVPHSLSKNDVLAWHRWHRWHHWHHWHLHFFVPGKLADLERLEGEQSPSPDQLNLARTLHQRTFRVSGENSVLLEISMVFGSSELPCKSLTQNSPLDQGTVSIFPRCIPYFLDPLDKRLGCITLKTKFKFHKAQPITASL